MYYLTHFILFLSAWLSLSNKTSKQFKNRLFFFCLFWLVFHDGFRWAVGTDWNNYLGVFQKCLLDNHENLEIGYYWLNCIVAYLTSSYTILLLVISIFQYYSFGSFFRKFSPYPVLSAFLMYFSMLSYMGMNRQFIAISILLLSVPFIIERKFIPFVCMMAVAFSFHSGSILFAPAYFMIKLRDKKFYFLLLAIAIMVALLGIVNRLPLGLFLFLGDRLGEKAVNYMDEQDAITPLTVAFGILKRLIWVILLLSCWDKIKGSKGLQLFFNLFFVSIMIYIVFNGTILQIMVQRGILYYSVFEFVLIPLIIHKFRRSLTPIIMLLLFAYGFWQMERSMNFYKESSGADIFRPYNAIYIDPNKVNPERTEKIY